MVENHHAYARQFRTYHGNIRILVHQVSQNCHLLLKIVLPHFTYPSSITVLPQRLVISQPMVHLTAVMWWLHTGPRPMRESHASTLTTKARVGESNTRPAQAGGTKGVAVCA